MEAKEDFSDFVKRFSELVINETGLNYKSLSLEDRDIDRIWLKIDGYEYLIRMWNIFENGNVDWSLFKSLEDNSEEVAKGFFNYKENKVTVE